MVYSLIIKKLLIQMLILSGNIVRKKHVLDNIYNNGMHYHIIYYISICIIKINVSGYILDFKNLHLKL